MALAVGGVQATSFAGTTEEQISQVLQKRITAGQQQTRVLKRGKRFENTAEHFAFELSEDLSKFGLVEMSPAELGEKNQWRILVEGAEPADIKRGKTFFGDGVSVKATTSKVRYTKGGVSVKSVHSVAIVKNTGATPLAYRIVLEPLTSGRCEVKGTRGHNAVALMPGEEAEVVVCAGSSGISVRALEVMEVSPVGFYYLSMLPPQALGEAPLRSNSHVPPRGAVQCGNVPARRISRALRENRLAWRDVVDFYSRHNCHRLQIHDGYAWTDEPRTEFPSLGPPLPR